MTNTIPAPMPYSADVLDRMIKTHTLAEVLAFAAAMAEQDAPAPHGHKSAPPTADTRRPPRCAP